VFPAAAGTGNVLAVRATASPEEICQGESAPLNASALGGSGNYTYSWEPTTGLNNPNIANPVANPVETTMYTVSESEGCESVSDQVTLVVNEVPVTPTITQEDDHLMSSATTGNQWYGSNGAISGATNQTFYPLATDHYYVKVENQFGCTSDPSNSIYFIYTSLAEQIDQTIRIYPNPSSGKIAVLPNANAFNADIQVFNLMSEQILNLNCNLDRGVPVIIDLSNVQKGIYFIRIKTEENNTTRKITIQ